MSVRLQLSGPVIIHRLKRPDELDGILENQEAFQSMDVSLIAYEVDSWLPVQSGTGSLESKQALLIERKN